jgi:hypothetical protein
MVSLPEAIDAVEKPETQLWYQDRDGDVVSGRPIVADETGVVFDDNTRRPLRQVSLRVEDVVLTL